MTGLGLPACSVQRTSDREYGVMGTDAMVDRVHGRLVELEEVLYGWTLRHLDGTEYGLYPTREAAELACQGRGDWTDYVAVESWGN